MTVHEAHRLHRTGWLRAAVLGANDGIVSTASLVIGIAAANATQGSIVLAGIAGLVAGAMSMAAGEYVSVSSQSDTERADLELEQASLDNNLEFETQELADIYRRRGLQAPLARQVAEQLMAHDALGAHARDELGITDVARANPAQAALSSALAFTGGALLPLLATWFAPRALVIPTVALCSMLFLALLGAVAAHTGGAPRVKGAFRVLFWGASAMLMTAVVGHWVGGILE